MGGGEGLRQTHTLKCHLTNWSSDLAKKQSTWTGGKGSNRKAIGSWKIKGKRFRELDGKLEDEEGQIQYMKRYFK